MEITLSEYQLTLIHKACDKYCTELNEQAKEYERFWSYLCKAEDKAKELEKLKNVK